MLTSENKFFVRLSVVETGRNVCFGGSSAPDTSGQNEAARMNAEIAKEMWQQYQRVYMPKEEAFAEQAFNYDTPQKREAEAGLANADVEHAFAAQRGQSEREMAAMGVNPQSGAWAANQSKMDLAEAAAKAGAQNAARRNVENMGYARKQDAISIGKGMPGQAASSMANAGSQYANIANTQMQQNQNNAAAVGNTVAGGAALYNMMKLKDGGMVEQRLAGGGMAGNPRMQQMMVTPTVMPVSGGGMNPAVTAGLNAVKTYKNIKDAAALGKSASNLAGNISNYGLEEVMTNNGITTGMNVPGLHVGSEQASMLAQQNLGLGAEGMAATADAAGTGIAAGADIAATGATAAGELMAGGAAAEGAGLAGALGGLGGAGGAALAALGPVGLAVGAGLLATQLFKKDGGEVRRKDLRKGGRVRGPGTSTSDSIPARLSNGEYVLNAESVKLVGKDRLDKINKAGLDRRYGLSDAGRDA